MGNPTVVQPPTAACERAMRFAEAVDYGRHSSGLAHFPPDSYVGRHRDDRTGAVCYRGVVVEGREFAFKTRTAVSA